MNIDELLKENEELKRQNKILLERIHNCKRKNREDKQRLLSAVRFLTGDKDEFLDVHSVSDMIWNADSVIASIIAEMLIRFKKTQNSIPTEIYTEYDNNEKEASKAWDEILDKIIYAFQLAMHNYEIKTDKEEQAKTLGIQLFAKYFDSFWV